MVGCWPGRVVFRTRQLGRHVADIVTGVSVPTVSPQSPVQAQIHWPLPARVDHVNLEAIDHDGGDHLACSLRAGAAGVIVVSPQYCEDTCGRLDRS